MESFENIYSLRCFFSCSPDFVNLLTRSPSLQGCPWSTGGRPLWLLNKLSHSLSRTVDFSLFQIWVSSTIRALPPSPSGPLPDITSTQSDHLLSTIVTFSIKDRGSRLAICSGQQRPAGFVSPAPLGHPGERISGLHESWWLRNFGLIAVRLVYLAPVHKRLDRVPLSSDLALFCFEKRSPFYLLKR